jgi:hypothetical protein
VHDFRCSRSTVWLSDDSLREIGWACEIDRVLEWILVGTNLILMRLATELHAGWTKLAPR